MKILHVIASAFFSGPDRQILELARALRQNGSGIQTVIASFSEGGQAFHFLDEAREAGFETYELQNDMPHLRKAAGELAQFVRNNEISAVFLHGHKPRMVAYLAAKRAGVPMIGVSRGWTSENLKIKLYNRIDKWLHRRMDHIVSVSQGQADKIIQSGTPKERVTVIHNAIRTERFGLAPNPKYLETLRSYFNTAPRFLLGAAGRFSPEKGYDVLLEAMSELVKTGISAGLVLFGEGSQEENLRQQIETLGLSEQVALPGFTSELDRFMPFFDVFVQSSHSEGLPNVLLEAMATHTAVVATDVGGTRELVLDAQCGLLVPAAAAKPLAEAIRRMLEDEPLRKTFEHNARKRVEEHFHFESQAQSYIELLKNVLPEP